MIIEKPFIEIRDNETYLIANIIDEVNHFEKEIFFKVSNEYGKYLSFEIADCFLTAILLPAMFTNQNIKINAPISSMLLYQLENNIIFTLSKVFNLKEIEIRADKTITPEYTPYANATGFSGGIDSFVSAFQLIENVPEEIKLTHLTLFNVGSYGNEFEKTEKVFNEDLKRAKKFADKFNLPLLSISSNLNEFYQNKNYKIYNFSPRSTMSLASAVLSLQKLFKNYFIASSGTIDKIRLNQSDQYLYEWLLTKFISNSRTQIHISNGNLNRVEKTKILSNYSYAKENLYVCAADIYNSKHNTNYRKDTAPNCSECIKCTRTLLILDILGEINNFSKVFDINKYNTKRNELLFDLYVNRNNQFLKEIYDLAIEKQFNFPIEVQKRIKKHKLIERYIQLKVRLYNILKGN